ncbi:MAG: TPR end-of-group domain-containing protein [Planctomycetaceae bacterium]
MAGCNEPQSAPDDPNADAGRSRRRKPRGGAAPAWFGTLSQLDFDIDFFEKVLARTPDSVEVLRVLAELVSRKGMVGRAVDLDRRLVGLLPEDFLARYNLACSLAREGRADEAIDALSRAILLGYDDLDHMESDPDLESIRRHPDFLALLGE